MISVDNRLMACAEMVEGTGVVCDVGTDHAFLPVYLVQSGRCKGVVASDCNDGPLEAALQTIEKYNVKDRISLKKADGLDGIDNKDVSDVILSGMGAELICKIISRAEWLKNNVNLVLQPMTKIPGLRKWLYKNGYEIITERAVNCGRCLYTVMQVRYSGVSVIISEVMAHIGKIDVLQSVGRAYAKKQVFRLRRAGESMQSAKQLPKEENDLLQTAENIQQILDKH